MVTFKDENLLCLIPDHPAKERSLDSNNEKSLSPSFESGNNAQQLKESILRRNPFCANNNLIMSLQRKNPVCVANELQDQVASLAKVVFAISKDLSEKYLFSHVQFSYVSCFIP